MEAGKVVAIFIAPEAGAPMQTVASARAVPGRGLEGDRYFAGRGSFSRWPGPRRELTLIAAEALGEMERETGIVISPGQSRRNVLVTGVPLNDLVKHEFDLGAVRVKGVGLAQPCKYLARLSSEPALVRAFVNRGGLRVQILTEGKVHVGDAVEW